jgi:23S rRNA (guanine2445-N2)-methyltransferase / 23S rRNA (guanine2069-N7)-methyltransferase
VEDLVAGEVEALGATDVSLGPPGVVKLTGDLVTAYRICLWSRCASRVLLPLATVRADSSDAFYRDVRDVPWHRHLAADATLAVHARLRRARAPNSHYVALRAKDAIVDRFRAETGRRPDVDLKHPTARIHVFVEGERAFVSFDLSGESLHRRGYREETGPAPLKETLAAAVLLRAGWPLIARAAGGFLDPLCGAGTLVLEAAAMAADVAPGLGRARFGFSGWESHDPGTWQRLVVEARERRERGLAAVSSPIRGTDLEGRAVQAARSAADRAGLASIVDFETGPLDDARPPGNHPGGLLATNPPYGERLGDPERSLEVYSTLGEVLRRRFGGWKAAVLAAEGRHLGAMRLHAYKTNRLYNGPIAVLLGLYELYG